MGLFSDKVAGQAKKAPRQSLTSALLGLLILDPKHPEGGYRVGDGYVDHDYLWSDVGFEELRRKLERGG